MLKMHKISLRERKHAQTKIDLVRATVDQMKGKRLKDISVKALCETIPISEVTFYNYFPKKTDLLVYMVRLWLIEMEWSLKQWQKEKSNLEIIEAIFDYAAQKAEESPVLLSEALRFFAQKLKKPCFEDVSVAERLIAFPDFPGIENIQPGEMAFAEMMKPYLEDAVASGELPQNTDVETIALMLDALHIGTMMKLHWKGNIQLRTFYRKQLQLIWDGLWAQATSSVRGFGAKKFDKKCTDSLSY
jgi:AcrR family transcriptional regulator